MKPDPADAPTRTGREHTMSDSGFTIGDETTRLSKLCISCGAIWTGFNTPWVCPQCGGDGKALAANDPLLVEQAASPSSGPRTQQELESIRQEVAWQKSIRSDMQDCTRCGHERIAHMDECMVEHCDCEGFLNLVQLRAKLAEQAAALRGLREQQHKLYEHVCAEINSLADDVQPTEASALASIGRMAQLLRDIRSRLESLHG